MRMMKVVIRCRGRERNEAIHAPWKLIATVPVHTLARPERNPYHMSRNVHPTSQENRPKSPREQNTDEVIDRVEILSADTDCVHEVMVQLVEIGVE